MWIPGPVGSDLVLLFIDFRATSMLILEDVGAIQCRMTLMTTPLMTMALYNAGMTLMTTLLMTLALSNAGMTLMTIPLKECRL